MNNEALEETVGKMMARGKGLLAADESVKTAAKRLDAVGVESTEENRRLYRELFLGAEGIEEYLSGVIFYDETFRQKSNDGTPYPELLERRGIVPGIKVDKSTIPFPGFPNEVLTAGLDGLAERFEEYYRLGARFAKWRVVVRIGEEIPTEECLQTNAILLARYARLAQEAGIVPMVEPEVLLDGPHSFSQSEDITEKTLVEVMKQLRRYRVHLPGVILKTSMVLPGSESGQSVPTEEVGSATLRMLHNSVPEELGGIVFLSGGQSPDGATINLNAINSRGEQPWGLTFSYARALQGPSLEIWRGKEENIAEARKAFLHRLKMNSLASKGEYVSKLEQEG